MSAKTSVKTSVLSFPERGKWGKSNYRGNCSGHIYKELFETFTPKSFVDPTCGSGTSIEVAKEMNIKAVGLDLHMGFNSVSDSILRHLGYESDMVVSHPPYGGQILYSGNMWGDPHPDDLSRCIDDDDFHQKLEMMMLNQREATKHGGIYGTIIGDWRRKGVYTSYQAEVIARMPADELAAVLIKMQHNVQSNQKQYSNFRLPLIMHEYILLFKKKERATIVLLRDLANTHNNRLKSTWKSIVFSTLRKIGGQGSLNEIYSAIAESAQTAYPENNHWTAKVRQILNSNPTLFKSTERGVWSIA